MLLNPNIIGTAAGILVSLAMLPQLIKIIKSKKAEDVSIGMLIALLAGVALWVYYGFLKTEMPIIITNTFSFIINSMILVFSCRYKKAKAVN